MSERTADTVEVRFTRLARDGVAELLNQIPESCRNTESLHRICDLAEALLDPGVSQLLPDCASVSLRDWVGDKMFPRKALALVALAVRAEIIRPGDGEDIAVMQAQLLSKLCGIYSTAPEAALNAVLQLGGPSAAGVPMWLIAALEDTAPYAPCQHMLDRVELAVRNSGPGRRWFEGVAGLGYVLFEKS